MHRDGLSARNVGFDVSLRIVKPFFSSAISGDSGATR